VWECALRDTEAKVLFDQSVKEVADWIRRPGDAVICDVSNAGIIYRKEFDASN